MIKYIEVSNFRSLGPDTRIDLENITFFVGQNGAGKSNIIDLFRFISDAMKIGLEGAITKRNGIKSLRRWSNGRPFNISIKIHIQDTEGYAATYQFSVGGHNRYEYSVMHEMAYIKINEEDSVHYEISQQKWISGPAGLQPVVSPMSLALPLISGDKRFVKLESMLKNTAIYNINPNNLRIPQQYDPQKPMTEHGGNWASILKDLKEDVWKDDLIIALQKLTGDIDDIKIEQLTSFLIARFRHGESGESKKPKWFDATQESDGTLRMAGMISSLLQQPHLPLIGIEEPEQTIHPGAIPIIYDYLLQAAAHSQVLVTTHSPELLDVVSDMQQIRVVSKVGDCTKIYNMADDQKQAVKDGLFTIGELHRTEGLRTDQLKLF
jgi:predicted ATPase